MLRFALLLPFAAALAGCVTTGARNFDDAARAKLRDENKSIVLLHTSMHEANCQFVQAQLARMDGSGRYVQGELVNLRSFLDAKVPSQITLEPGDYGIAHFKCLLGRKIAWFGRSRVIERGSILDGSGRIYEPMLTFKVGPGEVVDIGSVQMHTKAALGERPEFRAVIVPIPEEWLRNLAIANLKLVQERIVRPMSAPSSI